MNRVLHLVALLLISVNLFAQAPQRMSYQAVIRNASNNLITNAPVRMRISILQGGTNGTSVYSELHNPTTNANGLATIEIGAGTSPQGIFSAINWGNGTYFLRTETDPANGANYSIVGTSQLLSVPYALNANCVELSVSPIGDSVKIGCSSILLPGASKSNYEPKLNNGLVAYYPFNGNANDESGNGNNGAVNGSTLTTDRFGNANKAYNFNGSGNFIQVANSSSLNPSSVTINIWFKINPNFNGPNFTLLSKWNQNLANYFSYAVGNDYNSSTAELRTEYATASCIETQGGAKIGFSNGVSLQKGVWYMLTTTISNSGAVNMYLNGNLFLTKQGPNFIPCNNPLSVLRFGQWWRNDNQWFNGDMDDIRIYNRLLTQEEITYLANN